MKLNLILQECKFPVTSRIEQFIAFCYDAHRLQLRKYTHEAYIFHPVEVANHVYEFISKSDVDIAIALGHDLIEDTDCNTIELNFKLIEFGFSLHETAEIIYGIVSLTDKYTTAAYPDKNRAWRIEQEAIRLSNLPVKLICIKLCDGKSNLGSIYEHDPDFYATYSNEKLLLLKYIHIRFSVNLSLWPILTNLVNEAEKFISQNKINHG